MAFFIRYLLIYTKSFSLVLKCQENTFLYPLHGMNIYSKPEGVWNINLASFLTLLSLPKSQPAPNHLPMQGFSTSALLTLQTGKFLVLGNCSVHCTMVRRFPDLYPLDIYLWHNFSPRPHPRLLQKKVFEHCQRRRANVAPG